jgi:hypothetical protein
MRSLLNNLPPIYHINAASLTNRREPMGDRNRRSILGNCLQRLLNSPISNLPLPVLKALGEALLDFVCQIWKLG